MIIIWFLKDWNKEESPQVPNTPLPATRKPHFVQQYYSNHQVVYESHLLYYCEMLDIAGKQDITDLTIEERCHHKIICLENGDNLDQQLAEVEKYEAARAYLLDRWSYMTHLN